MSKFSKNLLIHFTLCLHFACGTIYIQRADIDAYSGLACFEERSSLSNLKDKCECKSTFPTIISKKGEGFRCYNDTAVKDLSGCKGGFEKISGNTSMLLTTKCKIKSLDSIEVWDDKSNWENAWQRKWNKELLQYLSKSSDDETKLKVKKGFWDSLLVRIWLTCDQFNSSQCLTIKFKGARREYPLPSSNILQEIVSTTTLPVTVMRVTPAKSVESSDLDGLTYKGNKYAGIYGRSPSARVQSTYVLVVLMIMAVSYMQ